jgi:hypothetical protein
MRQNKALTSTGEPDRELLDHLRTLQLRTIAEYQQWCVANGLSPKLDKDWKQRCHERFHAQRAAIRQRLDQRKREQRGPIDLLTGICKGRFKEEDLTQPYLKRLWKALQPGGGPTHERQIDFSSLRLLLHLQSWGAKFFDGTLVIPEFQSQPGNTYIEALVLLSTYHQAWLRPVETWKPRSNNARRQFASLLRHLFAKYDDVPAFLDAVWFADRTDEAARRRAWYLHVGRGESIRQCNLPISYTKKMAHHFMHAPAEFSVEQALRYGQVLGLGGDECLARALFGTRLIHDFEHDDFWVTVIQWFIFHALVARSEVGPIIDYLHQQRFVPQPSAQSCGAAEEMAPPQPNLTLKGQTPDGLLRKIEGWHRALARREQPARFWEAADIEPFTMVQAAQDANEEKTWTIRELLSSRALVAEGRYLKHCVATYTAACASRESSIWSMEVELSEGRTKALTIQVRNQRRQICQARGKANRTPTDEEYHVLRRWAAEAGLTVASFV